MTDKRPRASVTRRAFTAGAAAMPLVAILPSGASSESTAAVVIGAGAAGLAAAQTLRAAGRPVVLIEAAGRIGGRAHTDTSIFGVPYDVGAHWLHQANRNPFVAYARKNGFKVYPAPDQEILYVGNRKARAEEQAAYARAYQRVNEAIYKAGARMMDVSPASVVPDVGVWRDTVHFTTGAWEMGKDFEHFSCSDWYSGGDGKDWFCRQGYGAVLAHSGRGVPVHLNSRARSVKWGGHGVMVETSKGSISARACIVTVSTGVLNGGGIGFDPALPKDKQDAFASISMGLYNHIALQFRENFFGIGADGYVLYQVPNGDGGPPRAMGVLANVSGTTLSVCDVGGGFAAGLEREGQDGALDFALGELRKMFGSKVSDHFIKGHATAWSRNRLTLGSYASAEPGSHHLRGVLRRKVADRIWFAGEACSATEWATVSGAHKSGIAAAKSLMQTIPA